MKHEKVGIDPQTGKDQCSDIYGPLTEAETDRSNMEHIVYDEPTGEVKQVQLVPGTYVEAVRDSSYRGWVIGQWNDNPYMVRVVWEQPEVRIDIGQWDDIRPAHS